MRVSVVIPTYQRAGFVETAIESVLRQGYPDVEVLVLDDGSTDETPAILERIAERHEPERFRWWRHDNVGQSETINRGFAHATGELLGYLSSDDYLLPGAIERLVAAAGAHPDADVVYPWCDVVDPADRVVDVLELREHTLADALRWSFCLVGSGALVRRRYLERVGGWDATFPHSPDFEWWLRGGDARFVCVPERLAVWRQHEASLTSTMSVRARFEEQLRILDDVFARDGLPEEVVAVRDQAYAALLIASGAALLRPEDVDPRFVLWDRVGERISCLGRDTGRRAAPEFAQHVEALQQQLRQVGTTAERREQTIGALARSVEHQAVRIELLEAELAAARAERPARPAEARPRRRPLWLRVGRALTPPPYRHPVGVLVHRLWRPDR